VPSCRRARKLFNGRVEHGPCGGLPVDFTVAVTARAAALARLSLQVLNETHIFLNGVVKIVLIERMEVILPLQFAAEVMHQTLGAVVTATGPT
jgi:hypothetical protein